MTEGCLTIPGVIRLRPTFFDPFEIIAHLTDPKHPKVGLFYCDPFVDELFNCRYLGAHWHRSGPGWYDISGAVPKWAGNTPDTSNDRWTDHPDACAFRQGRMLIPAGYQGLLLERQ